MILRRASIAPVIVGIALEVRPGSETAVRGPSQAVPQVEEQPVVGGLEAVRAVASHADADASPQMKGLGMVSGQSPLPRVSRQASTGPSGYQRALLVR